MCQDDAAEVIVDGVVFVEPIKSEYEGESKSISSIIDEHTDKHPD